MLIRIKKRSGGIEEYLQEGKKQGRTQTRDALDERVVLRGDLNTLSSAIKYAQNFNNWHANYTHITLSFTHEEIDIDLTKMTNLVDEVVAHFFHLYRQEELATYAEAHLPKFQHELNAATGEQHQRLAHIHLVVAHLNTQTFNELRMLPFETEADRAFQSYLCEKYDLVDPANCQRQNAHEISKKNFIARLKANDNAANKQSKKTIIRETLAELLQTVSSLDDARECLKNADWIEQVTLVTTKKNQYFKVRVENQSFNLRGKSFENLAQFYANPVIAGTKPAVNVINSQAERIAYLDAHKKKHRENQYQKKKSKTKAYAERHQTYQTWLDKLLQEQKTFYVIYRHTIKPELIQGFTFFDTLNEHYLINVEEGIKIYDKGDKIIISVQNDAALVKAIHVALGQAIAKGWDINDLTVEGSAKFKAAVEKEINRLYFDHQDKASAHNLLPLIPCKTERHTALYDDNVAKELMLRAQEIEVESLSKERIALLKQELAAESVLAYAIEHLGLLAEHFVVTSDNKIQDTRTHRKPQNVVDFLCKSCHFKISAALPLLDKLYTLQPAHNIYLSDEMNL